MVSEIVVSPNNVRGLGNIVSPAKTLEDFNAYKASVEMDTEDIDGIPSVVFILTGFYSTQIILNVPIWCPFVDNGSFDISYILLGDDETPLANKTILTYIGEDYIGSSTSNSDGEGTINIDMSDEIGYEYPIRLVFEGTDQFDECEASETVIVGCSFISLDITGTKLREGRYNG
jgi:hypothetical protein